MRTLDKQHDDNRNITAATVLHFIEAARPETEIERIIASFSANKNLQAIPVVKNGQPVGLINRHACMDSCELLGKKPCSAIMNTSPLLVEKATPIHELSGFLSESETRYFTDGFIITEQGRYIGIGTVQDLLREITKAQIETARHANPLTSLPGNAPINEHISHLLQSGASFSVCYADLDHFKAFNDACGYSKGDELIQFTAKLLGNFCDPTRDFIGHIGGDDFVLVLRSADWEQRCHRALSAFAHTSPALFDRDHRSIGGYLNSDRQGRLVHHPLPTLSVGVARVNPELFNSHHEVVEAAVVAKNMAKKKPGNSLFIERRCLQQQRLTEEQHADAYYG